MAHQPGTWETRGYLELGPGLSIQVLFNDLAASPQLRGSDTHQHSRSSNGFSLDILSRLSGKGTNGNQEPLNLKTYPWLWLPWRYF